MPNNKIEATIQMPPESYTPLMRSRSESNSSELVTKHIVIIGAGLAGLSAAKALCDEYEVTVVEGKAKAGGRVLSGYVELGAQSCTNHEPEINKWADELGLTKIPSNSARYYYWDKKKKPMTETVRLYKYKPGSCPAYQVFKNAFSHELASLNTNIQQELLYQSFDDLLKEKQLTREATFVIKSGLIGLYAGDLKKINALAVLRFYQQYAKPDTQAFKIDGGNQLLASKMVEQLINKGVQFVYQYPVTSVSVIHGRYQVKSGTRLIGCDAVIVATTLEPIKSAIDYLELPYDLRYYIMNAKSNSQYLRVYRIESPWPAQTIQARVGTLIRVIPNPLGAYVTLQSTVPIDSEVSRTIVLEALGAGHLIKTPLNTTWNYAWHAPQVNEIPPSKISGNRIAFAGEAFNTLHPASMEGAITSGMVAAEEIRHQLTTKQRERHYCSCPVL